MGRYGWRNEDGVRGTRGRIARLSAICEGCDWMRRATSPSELAGGAVRVAARRHASADRHVVRIEQTNVRHYEPDPVGPAGSLSQRAARDTRAGAPR